MDSCLSISRFGYQVWRFYPFYAVLRLSVVESDEDAFIERICNAANKHTSKTSQYHGCWCLAVQRLPATALIRNFPRIFQTLRSVLTDIIDSEDRELIDKEAMQVWNVQIANSQINEYRH